MSSPARSIRAIDHPDRPARARALAAPCFALAAAAATAVAWQDFGGALPLGLFNEGRDAYAWLARASLAAATVLAAVFAWELARGRVTAAGGVARGTLASLLLLELLVHGVDTFVVAPSGASGRALGGPYREAESAVGTRVFLKRAHAGSPLGFRAPVPHAKEPAAPRILFLGDSYTEGSGRDAACNYPEVAAATLNAARAARGLPPFEPMNAGVAGYGPEESLALLRYLREDGYRFDAIVLSVFVENDFSDDLPGTERRVVAGINFRYPRSPFLRWLHPLNTHTARYAMFLWQAASLGRADDAVQRGDGKCRPPPPLPDPLPAELADLVRRRYASNYGPAPQLAMQSVADALAAIRAEAAAQGVPLAVVIFPDRVVADREIRARLGLSFDLDRRNEIARLRAFVAEHAGDATVIDTTEALTDGSVNYRSSDTHLSDVGNVVAGELVGKRLAEVWGAERR